MHVAIVGTGRVGATLAYTLSARHFVDELSLADVAPGLAAAVREELLHGLAVQGRDVRVHAYEDASLIEGAEIVVVTAGKPRRPHMSRRDLAAANARIIGAIADAVYPRNPDAWYLVVTNPVDAMAALFHSRTASPRVLGSGTQLDTARFRAALADVLGLPVSRVEAYVAGEHGPRSVFLWSMARVDGAPLDAYLEARGYKLGRGALEEAVRESARRIIARTGGTVYGPAAVFAWIVEALATGVPRLATVSAPFPVPGAGEHAYISTPRVLARGVAADLYRHLPPGEREAIAEAAKEVYATYLAALESLERGGSSG